MASELLENYLDTIEALPLELQRNYSLIKEFDGECRTFTEQIEQQAMAFEGASEKERQVILQQLNATFKQVIDQTEKKVTLAAETYELVDKHVRRLDEDLQRFEDELTVTGLGSISAPSAVISSQQAVEQLQQQEQQQQQLSSTRKRKQQNDPVTSSAVKKSITRKTATQPAPMFEVQRSSGEAADSNEPTYCVCNQVSFGAMIGCDNEDCDIEWFHYACVGLTSPPVGKWYCKDCLIKMQS